MLIHSHQCKINVRIKQDTLHKEDDRSDAEVYLKMCGRQDQRSLVFL